MLKHFKGSFIVTVLGLAFAWFWGTVRHPGHELLCVFVVFFLSILEITLSFDNAVVNAMKLEKMTEKWQHRFVTWGILIAVFGMRLLFPLGVVALFTGLSLPEVANLAMNDVSKYESCLHACHVPLVTFGGAFLFMLFLSYFCGEEKDIHWLKFPEEFLQKCHLIKTTEALVTLIALAVVFQVVPNADKSAVLLSGVAGIVLYVLIDELSNALERFAQKKADLVGGTAKLGFIGFLYLELIDASFSLDGVLGAFAISKDIIIIMTGLAIGAMFVRSLTLYMVESKTLQKYLYLEHGAHWAIGLLALIMFSSTVYEVPEAVTGLTGLVIVGKSFIDSILYNKKSKMKN